MVDCAERNSIYHICVQSIFSFTSFLWMVSSVEKLLTIVSLPTKPHLLSSPFLQLLIIAVK